MIRIRGTALFEFLLGTLLISFVLVAGSNFTISILQMVKRLTSHSREVRSESVLRNWLEKIVENVDSHRFNLPPKIHPRGHITFADGSPYSLTIPPNTDSVAISSLLMDPIKMLDFVNCKSKSDRVVVRACLRFPGIFQQSLYSMYVGIDANGVSPWVGEVRGRGRCKTIELRSVKDLVLDTKPNSDGCLLHTLIPVRAEETIYLSTQNELRFLKVVGDRIIENQPLPCELEYLNLSLLLPLENLIYGVQANYKTANSPEHQCYFFHHLGRLTYYNLLLNS